MTDHITKYLDDLKGIINSIDHRSLEKTIEIIKKARQEDKRIFVFGNGGSAATANHFAADFGKNAVKGDANRFKIISLSNNISSITACGNDIGFETVFEEQLKNLMHDGDLVICISASGNSPNIVRAVEYVRKRGGTIIGITGFDGGKLGKMSDININIASDSYEQIEDMHLVITHIIVYWFKSSQKE
jgi:D-sedoheptulose 7-phosphate isomerase